MPEDHDGASPNARLLAGSLAASEASWQSYGRCAVGAVAAHLAVLLVIIFSLTRMPESSAPPATHEEVPNITWLTGSGEPAGGGGSGHDTPDPARQVKLSAPRPRAAEPPPKIADASPPPPLPTVPAMTAMVEVPGASSALPDATALGPGTGANGGTGDGVGEGPGAGPGLGPGSLGGTGGGEYRAGNGVTPPVLIREIRPNYTGEAMQARIQGEVTMEALVMPDGSVGRVHITRSLDQTFGLDQEALKTIKQWRFRPGTRQGRAVAVLILVELSFTLR